MRFALLEAKMALVSLLAKYDFKTCSKTPDEIVLDPVAILGAPKDPIFIQITERN